MDQKDNLIRGIKSQRRALDVLLDRLEQKHRLEMNDYQMCEVTTAAVEKGLQSLRVNSLDGLIREILWREEETIPALF